MQSNLLKIISLNIERDCHFDKLLPFVKKEQPDILLLQEVFAKDVVTLENVFAMSGFFSVLNTFLGIENSELGLCTFTALPIAHQYQEYYRGNGKNIPEIRIGFREADRTDRAIQVVDFIKNGQHFVSVNTHFTWTPDAKPSEKQYTDLSLLLKYLSKIPDFFLCGDFNAPRGGPIFDQIAAKYQDNIPRSVTTTIDKDLHKAGDLNIVVDGFFTTPEYIVKSLEVVSGLSDHCAILAEILKV